MTAIIFERCRMGGCKFIAELNRLRKSSSDSIDNVEKFDPFKVYMHVTRTAENDLKNILRRVNDTTIKTLVLLCGSAGDGKSHLLSFLKNSDEEHLLDGYTVFNDATESNSPSKTAIETLNELLAPFNDDNLDNSGNNIILAINLGVLNNFIESSFGNRFTQLKSYVINNYILSSQISDKKYSENSHFQHVSFSDYHMYSLTENGAKSNYIESLLKKIFSKDDSNPFYSSHLKDCSNCTLAKKCPVKLNYEYLLAENRQRYIADTLIRTAAQDKVILTTREILNFIYDIVVAQDFNVREYQKIIEDSAFLKIFTKHITPSLLFESYGVTPLMNTVHQYDPLLIRSEKSDEFSISYYVSSDISNEVRSALKNTPYERVLCDQELLSKVNNDRSVKSRIFNLIIRAENIDNNTHNDLVYKEYLKDLYNYNAGKEKKLRSLYSMIQKGIIQWCGSDLDGNLCLDDRHHGFTLYENISFEESLDHIPHPSEIDELQRFFPSIIVAFADRNGGCISLDVDYSLYKMIYKLNRGYIQTADDRNNHADFIGFVSKMLQTGSLTESMTITSDNGQRAYISKGKFGYKFKVVR